MAHQSADPPLAKKPLVDGCGQTRPPRLRKGNATDEGCQSVSQPPLVQDLELAVASSKMDTGDSLSTAPVAELHDVDTRPSSPDSHKDDPRDWRLEDTKSSAEHAGISQRKKTFTRSTIRGKVIALFRYLWWIMCRGWDLACLLILLATVAAIPVVQLASLGYLLRASGNLAQRRGWRASLPGLQLAGKLGSFVTMSFLTWLPVWLISDLAYSSQLLSPGTDTARNWRLVAFGITALWLINLIWAAVRGGRWWHFLWPAPMRFLKCVSRRETWATASKRLYETICRLHPLSLWWLGLRAAGGAMLWIVLPVSLMIIGQRAEDVGPAALVGLLGAIGMTFVILRLPFLQIQMAASDSFKEFFNLRQIRRNKKYAPWAHALSLLSLCALSIPLYLLRMEATPEELLWAPALVFVLFMLPAKLLMGAAMGYAVKRQAEVTQPRNWMARYSAGSVSLTAALIYVGALYVAQLVAGQGAFVMYFQHALLVPAPLL